MANLTKCKTCKKKISSQASTCPNCGQGSPQWWKCFVATTVYGSEIAPEVSLLRQFRDEILIHNLPGKLFVDFYYRYSPPFATWLEDKYLLKRTTRKLLDTFINSVVKKSLKKDNEKS